MVVLGIGNPGHGVDEGHALVKALELEAAADGFDVIGQFPARYVRQQGLGFRAGKGRDAAFAGDAVAVGQVTDSVHGGLQMCDREFFRDLCSFVGGLVHSQFTRFSYIAQ